MSHTPAYRHIHAHTDTYRNTDMTCADTYTETDTHILDTQTQIHTEIHTETHRHTRAWVPALTLQRSLQTRYGVPSALLQDRGWLPVPAATSPLLSDLHTRLCSLGTLGGIKVSVSAESRAGGNDIYRVHKYYLTDPTPPA